MKKVLRAATVILFAVLGMKLVFAFMASAYLLGAVLLGVFDPHALIEAREAGAICCEIWRDVFLWPYKIHEEERDDQESTWAEGHSPNKATTFLQSFSLIYRRQVRPLLRVPLLRGQFT